jgi:hypothetical protein
MKIPKRSIRIARNIQSNSIIFSLDQPDSNINISKNFLLEANIVIDILNSYFNKKNTTHFLGRKKTKKHPKFKIVKKEMNKSYTNLTQKIRTPKY